MILVLIVLVSVLDGGKLLALRSPNERWSREQDGKSSCNILNSQRQELEAARQALAVNDRRRSDRVHVS